MAPRATKRSFGSIRKLPSGRFQARYTAPSGSMVSAPTTFAARIDAEAWLASERRRVEEPETWRPPKVRLQEARQRAGAKRLPKFREYAERWIESRRNSRGNLYARSRGTSIGRHSGCTSIQASATFPSTRSQADVRAWHEGLDACPTARAHAYATLRTILNTAVADDELLSRNPAYVRGAGMRGGRKNLKPASLNELATMVEAMPDGRKLLLLLATWCALRSGELRELRRSDIVLGSDEDGTPFGWVNVSRGVVRARTGMSGRGQRTRAVVGAPRRRPGCVRSRYPASCCLPSRNICPNTPRQANMGRSSPRTGIRRCICRKRHGTAVRPSWMAKGRSRVPASAGVKLVARQAAPISIFTIFAIRGRAWQARKAPASPS